MYVVEIARIACIRHRVVHTTRREPLNDIPIAETIYIALMVVAFRLDFCGINQSSQIIILVGCPIGTACTLVAVL